MFKTQYGTKSLEDICKDHGLSDAFSRYKNKAVAYSLTLKKDLPGFAARVSLDEDLAALQARARYISDNFDDLVIFGTGGSSLGGQAASAIAAYHNPGPALRLHFPDSLDPFEMDRLFKQLAPQKSHYLVISKSGTTAETLAQALSALACLEAAELGDIADHFTFITEPGDRPLRQLAEKLGSPVLDHPTDIGGRFSVLSVVGMLPVASLGLDPKAFRLGAEAVLAQFLNSPQSSPVCDGAALATALSDKGINQVCLMPYAESLRGLTRWFGQLWAESLGKEGRGTTPLSAVGPVDQHSQLQLYLDGPKDKYFTLITVPSYNLGPRIEPNTARLYGLDYMAGRTIGDMVTCQAKATGETLRGRAIMVRDFIIDRLSEENLGALFMHYMLETITTAHLIGVNAFDQPAVEEGKHLTRHYLSQL